MPGPTSPIVHGNGFHGLQYNLYALAPKLRPDLAVIDGYQAMEGNGPVAGTPVEHRVAVASLDWLAADRVAVALMGIDLAKMGYLNYCAAAGMGEVTPGPDGNPRCARLPTTFARTAWPTTSTGSSSG